MICHHALIRRIVPLSQGDHSAWPLTISSIVCAQCRLYGTTQSGSSWWIRLHFEHFNRRIISFTMLPSLSISLRTRQPRADNNSPHMGQWHSSFAITKSNTALIDKTVV